MVNKKETMTVGTRISKGMHKAILKRLEHTNFLNVSNYLRVLIRRDLEAKGLLES